MKFERNSLVSINIFQRNICLSVEMERFSRDSTRNHLEISNLSPGECKFDKRGGRKSRKEQGSTLVEKEKDGGRKLTRKATREGGARRRSVCSGNREGTRMKYEVKWSKKLRLVAREKFARLRITSVSNCGRSYRRDEWNRIQLRKRISLLVVFTKRRGRELIKGTSDVIISFFVFRPIQRATPPDLILFSKFKINSRESIRLFHNA